MKIKNIILLMSLFSFSLSAQNEMESLNILIGQWELENNNFILIEEWTKINETNFEGFGYSVEKGEKNIFEKFNILKLHNYIVYIAQPGNNLPTLFTLISSDDNKFIFENKEHDFPQRVIYHFTTDNTLNASIEGVEKGEMKKKEFSFKKVK